MLCSPNSYNPLEGPNENPEAELPLTAGEYIYIYGDMDEDGFFEGRTIVGITLSILPAFLSLKTSVLPALSLSTLLPPQLFRLSAKGCSEIWDSWRGERHDWPGEGQGL